MWRGCARRPPLRVIELTTPVAFPHAPAVLHLFPIPVLPLYGRLALFPQDTKAHSYLTQTIEGTPQG